MATRQRSIDHLFLTLLLLLAAVAITACGGSTTAVAHPWISVVAHPPTDNPDGV